MVKCLEDFVIIINDINSTNKCIIMLLTKVLMININIIVSVIYFK